MRHGEWPAIVRAYSRETRECRVEIPGITDGAELFPLADIRYPIGDKSEHTEIRILEGDRVWVAFECGDERYPIITGWRVKRDGNDVGTRRWHHDNFESTADLEYTVHAGQKITLHCGDSTIVATVNTITVNTGTVIVNATDHADVTTPRATVNATEELIVNSPLATFNVTHSQFNGTLTVNGLLTYQGGMIGSGGEGGLAAAITGDMTVTGQISTPADVLAATISLKTHYHSGATGDNTDPPVP